MPSENRDRPTPYSFVPRSELSPAACSVSNHKHPTSVRRSPDSAQSQECQDDQDNDDYTYNPDDLVHGSIPFSVSYITLYHLYGPRFGALANDRPIIPNNSGRFEPDKAFELPVNIRHVPLARGQWQKCRSQSPRK